MADSRRGDSNRDLRSFSLFQTVRTAGVNSEAAAGDCDGADVVIPKGEHAYR
jgi:hypothetical protein